MNLAEESSQADGLSTRLGGVDLPPPEAMRGVDDPAAFARGLEAWRSSAIVSGPRYRVASALGQGSQGLVLAVEDRDFNRRIAVKVLNRREIDPASLHRFLREAQVTAQLEHPGIVPVHEFGVLPDGTVFYAMKRIEGASLAEILARPEDGPRSRPDLLDVFLKACDAVAFAHSRGVVHRDLKPRNIMVGRFGEVLVLDWGLAKMLDGDPEDGSTGDDRLRTAPMGDAHRTLVGSAVGTPAYMSPEQARGRPADRRSDVFSLGVLLYHLLSGESPWLRGDAQHTLEQVAAGHWTPLPRRAAGAKLPHRLVAVVHKALALRPEDRYQSVEELARDLRAFRAGEAVAAYQETPAEALIRLAVLHRRSVGAASLVLVLAIAAWGGWAGWTAWNQAHRIEALRMEAARCEQDLTGNHLDQARRAYERLLDLLPGDRAANDGLKRLQDLEDSREADRLAQARRSEAVFLLAEAGTASVRARELGLRWQTLRTRCADLRTALEERPSGETRSALRQAETETAAVAADRAKALAETVALLLRADALAPAHPPVRSFYADFFVERLREAEAREDGAEAAAALAQARAHDDGSRSELLAGRCRLANGSEQPVVLRALRCGEERTLVPLGDPIAVMAGSEVVVDQGRYLVEGAGGQLRALRLLRGETFLLVLSTPPPLPDGTVWIPAGTVFGSERQPLARVQAFALMAHEVRAQDYLEFLNDPETHRVFAAARERGELILAPRQSAQADDPLWRQRPAPPGSGSGDFILERSGDGAPVPGHSPVAGISVDDARAYAAWRARRDRLPWRLPSAAEWRLAAQGGDGRLFPWGDLGDPGLCASARTVSGHADLPRGGSFPPDRSVQGVWDLAGSLSEFAEDGAIRDPQVAVVLGGNRFDRESDRFSTLHHREVDRRHVHAGCGFRLALTPPP